MSICNNFDTKFIVFMKDFEAISEGIKNWNKTARSLREANRILNIPIEFLLNDELPLDNSQTSVNVYFGYQNSILFAVLIQASKDLPERYRDDLEGVMQDMIVVNATRRLLTTTTEAKTTGTVSGTQIESVRALKRIARWENEFLRVKVMKSVNTAPLIFEIPKVNFEIQGQKKLLFGLRITKKCCFFKKLEYDFLLKSEADTNLRAVAGFYDAARPVPPFPPAVSKGLYEYLRLSI